MNIDGPIIDLGDLLDEVKDMIEEKLLLNGFSSVVMCKDCEYNEFDIFGNTWCNFHGFKIREMPNGYCWHGERKKD